MAEKKIFEILNKLKSELHKPLDHEDKARVETIIKGMEDFLRQAKTGSGREQNKILDQLKSGTEHFAETHPELSIQIGRVMDLLNQMGI